MSLPAARKQASLTWCVELGAQLLRSDGAVGIGYQLRYLVGVDRHVEEHAEPTAASDVGRNEEARRIGCDQLVLPAFGGGAPERKPVVMVVIRVVTNSFLSRTNHAGSP